MRYPTEMPLTDMRNVFDFVRGNPNNLPKSVVVESSWWVVGYGCSFTQQSSFVLAASNNSINEEIATILEPSLTYSASTFDREKINWGKLIQLILSLLPSLLT